MFYEGGMFMGGMHWLWWIFWVGLAGLVVFYGFGRTRSERQRPRETPHEVLKRRLASGEIVADEYEKRKALLDRDAGSNA